MGGLLLMIFIGAPIAVTRWPLPAIIAVTDGSAFDGPYQMYGAVASAPCRNPVLPA
jgi:hypothetical protein